MRRKTNSVKIIKSSDVSVIKNNLTSFDITDSFDTLNSKDQIQHQLDKLDQSYKIKIDNPEENNQISSPNIIDQTLMINLKQENSFLIKYPPKKDYLKLSVLLNSNLNETPIENTTNQVKNVMLIDSYKNTEKVSYKFKKAREI